MSRNHVTINGFQITPWTASSCEDTSGNIEDAATGSAGKPRRVGRLLQKKIQQLRKVKRIGQIRIGLEDALSNQQNLKAFVMGSPGVGKTTEISKYLLGPFTNAIKNRLREHVEPSFYRTYAELTGKSEYAAQP